MPRTLRYPRNEAARRDRIAQHEIIHGAPRMHQARNDAIAANPYGNAALAIALSGTAIADGVLESEIIAGDETLIIDLTGDTWHADIGSDSAATAALIAGITGDDAGGTGWNDEVTIAHGNVARTSDTRVTITLPASASYAIAADETVTVAVPAAALASGGKGETPAAQTFDVTNEA